MIQGIYLNGETRVAAIVSKVFLNWGGGLEALGIQTQGLGVAGAQLPAKCSAQDEPCWGLVIEAIGFL